MSLVQKPPAHCLSFLRALHTGHLKTNNGRRFKYLGINDSLMTCLHILQVIVFTNITAALICGGLYNKLVVRCMLVITCLLACQNI